MNDSRAHRTIRQRGMTLVEVLAVVVILGLIAGTLAVGFSGAFGKAKSEIARIDIGSLVQRVETYRISTGSFPSSDIGLGALSEGSATPSDPYWVDRDALNDPWGEPYLYVVPGSSGYPYEIISYGADGQQGGSDEDRDISSVGLRSDDER